MTKKYFEAAARMVAFVRADKGTEIATTVAAVLMELFAGDNPRFDRGRFLKACGL